MHVLNATDVALVAGGGNNLIDPSAEPPPPPLPAPRPWISVEP